MPAAFLVLTGFTSNKTFAVTCLCLAVGISGMSLSGFSVNHLDIAPRYAGLLMGITNAAGTLPGIIGPYVAGAMTPSPPGSHVSTGNSRDLIY